jgi:hypothetical protein
VVAEQIVAYDVAAFLALSLNQKPVLIVRFGDDWHSLIWAWFDADYLTLQQGELTTRCVMQPCSSSVGILRMTLLTCAQQHAEARTELFLGHYLRWVIYQVLNKVCYIFLDPTYLQRLQYL